MQINLRHSKTAAASLAQVICENDLDVILIQEPYAIDSNQPTIVDIPAGYIAIHTLDEMHAYGVAIFVKLTLASSSQTITHSINNHVVCVVIGRPPITFHLYSYLPSNPALHDTQSLP